MRRGGAKKRRDVSEAAIVQALRACGAFVQQISGDGCPDLLVGWRGTWMPLEVKSARGTVRPNQTRYPIVRTVDEALALFGELYR